MVWRPVGVGGLVALTFIAAIAQADAVVPSEVIDQSAADSMVQRCLSRSKANAWPPFSIVVVDAAGAIILLRRQDGASAVTADAALLKAQTAARAGAPTAALAALSQDPATRDLMMLLRVTSDPGGLPIKLATHTIGAIGVSGGTAEQDAACASAAISNSDVEKK